MLGRKAVSSGSGGSVEPVNIVDAEVLRKLYKDSLVKEPEPVPEGFMDVFQWAALLGISDRSVREGMKARVLAGTAEEQQFFAPVNGMGAPKRHYFYRLKANE